MFERYTQKAQRVIFFARHEASELGSRAIEPEHLLLGLLREDPGLFGSPLTGDRDRLDALRDAVIASLPEVKRFSASSELPFAPLSKEVFNLAAQASNRLGRRHIGTNHLLLGLIEESRSEASRILREHGFTAETLIAQISSSSSIRAAVMLPEARLNALVALLIRKGVFSPAELEEQPAGRYLLPATEATLSSLLDLLTSKGVISEDEKQAIINQGE